MYMSVVMKHRGCCNKTKTNAVIISFPGGQLLGHPRGFVFTIKQQPAKFSVYRA